MSYSRVLSFDTASRCRMIKVSGIGQLRKWDDLLGGAVNFVEDYHDDAYPPVRTKSEVIVHVSRDAYHLCRTSSRDRR